MSTEPINLAVLISGSGTTLQNFIDRIADGSLAARIGVVIASRPGIAGIERAKKAGLACEVVDRKKFSSVCEFSKVIFSKCEAAGAELVCLAGWLSLLEIPEKFQGRVMNIHPALLPDFGGQGMYGKRVHQAVLDQRCNLSGCTVHFVDASYDTGPIILQRVCPVLEDDSADTLAHRVFEEEKIAYPKAIRLYQAGRLKVEGRHVRLEQLH
jgi:phosphoribosylglycinamide formyltransferase 1